MSGGLLIAAIVISVIGAILIAVMIAPEKKRDRLQGFAGWLNDLFNFRTLFIEKILKFLYILSTCFCLIGGLFMLFGSMGVRYGGDSIALYGLGMIVLGPIAVRILYESGMMFVLLVKNTIQINNKLGAKNGDKSAAPAAPTYAAPAAPTYAAPAAPNYVFCTNCGTKYDANTGRCPKCGK